MIIKVFVLSKERLFLFLVLLVIRIQELSVVVGLRVAILLGEGLRA